MSFFEDGEETAQRSASAGAPEQGAAPPRRARPRRPQRSGRPLPADQHTLMVRRRVAAGAAVVALIVIVLIINGCLKSQRVQSLKDYNHNVGVIATESDEQVSAPLFSTLSGASGKSALNVEEQVDQLRIEAQNLANRADGLSVPGEMASAQRNFTLAMNLREEGLTKIAGQLPSALGANGKQAITYIAGAMQTFLASDVLYSQRVAPLIQQELAGAGVSGVSTAASSFLPNLGWLEPNTVSARITGQSASSSQPPVTGNHGSALKGTSVGSNTLESEPTLNHITGGSSPTFTVMVENSGEFPETNVKVTVTVTAGGKQFKASHAIEKTEPGKTVSVDIPVAGVPLGVASKIETYIEGVPGENDLENNKGTYLAVFEQ